MAYRRKDGYYRKAKREGYRSRAAYKLIELDRRLNLFRKGIRVLDLGCSPGGWTQVASERVGKRGKVVGVDRLPTEPLQAEQVELIRGDVREARTMERLRTTLGGPVDLVLSDMAPDTTGIGFADHARSMELARLAVNLANESLGRSGALVVKVFEGPDLNALTDEMRESFSKLRRLRLRSTRKGSREKYIFARRQP